MDIDATASKTTSPQVYRVISDLCLACYSTEVLALLLLFGLEVLRDWMMVVDVLIVFCGWGEKIFAALAPDSELGFRIAVLRAGRLVRIFRLMRLLKRIRPLRELHKLVMMMATCLRTLVWSFILLCVVMTVWAMLMVELIYPALQEMIEKQEFVSCDEECQRAMSSVMDANLLLFKTVIAGDSWGEIAVPVIQRHPATAIIFVGSQLTLVFGVLNLIVAVVVDTFADARQNDVQNLAEEMEDEIEYDRKSLGKLFERIDKDGSGQLTLQEMIEGARNDPGMLLENLGMKIESKLDLLLLDATRRAAMALTESRSPALEEFSLERTKARRVKAKKMLHPEAFRSMYMSGKHRRLSLVELGTTRDQSKDATPKPRRRSLSSNDITEGDPVSPISSSHLEPMTNAREVYGMNFENHEGVPTIPFLLETYGYTYFWYGVLGYFTVAFCCVVVMYRRFLRSPKRTKRE
eukprot:g23854.t1